MEIEETDGLRQWHIPSPKVPRSSLPWDKQRDLYYQNVVYLLQLRIPDATNLIFHLNFMQSRTLVDALKRVFRCKTILAVHYFGWCFSLSGNVSRFGHTIGKNGETGGDSLVSAVIESYREEKRFLDAVDKVLCLSESACTLLKEYYQMPPNRLQVVYNGLSDTACHRKEKTELQQRFGLPCDAPVILFVGRLEYSKGITCLVRAFRIVLEHIPSCRLILAGNGSYDDCLKECAGVWPNVHFTGFVPPSTLDELYEVADIGVMPSFHEQCSYVGIEMMMHGIPVIASSSTGLREMIEDGVTGLHVPVIEYPDRVEISTELLAEKMLYLLEHPEERERMGQNARKRYEQLYTANIMGEKMIRLYQQLLR
jgi:glycosyltransferase